MVVTVVRDGENKGRDLELPATVPAAILAGMVNNVMGWDSGESVDYEIEAHPGGRFLKPDESLEEAGVWDGGWLIFYPVEP